MATFQKRGKRWRAIIRRKGLTESKTFPTKAAAAEWARRVEHGADLSIVQDYTKPTATNTIAWAIREYSERVGPVRPFGRSKTKVLEALSRDLGDVGLGQLSASRLNRYIADRVAGGAGGVTIGIDLSTLGTVLRWVQAVERIQVNVQAVQDARDTLRFSGLQTRSSERERRPTQAELDKLFAHWRDNPRQGIPMQDLCEFAIASAMRIGEICRITWEDCDLDAKTIIVRDRKDPRRKAGNHQRVPLLAATGYDAAEIVKRQPTRKGRIFPYNSRSVSAAFTRAVKACKIVDLHLHDLRHEGTSRLFEAGYSIPEVALCTGHKDWKMLARYTQTRAEELHR